MSQHHKHADQAHPGSGKNTTTTRATAASGDRDHNAELVSTEAVRLCAYRKWESAGMPVGDGIQFWLEAERELLSR